MSRLRASSILLVAVTFLSGCQSSPLGRFSAKPSSDKKAVDERSVQVEEKSSFSLFSLGKKSEFDDPNAIKPATHRSASEFEKLLTRGALDEAEVLLRKRIESRPKDYKARTNLGILLSRSERTDEALLHLNQVVQKHADYCPAQSQLAHIHRLKFDIAKAEQAYLACLSDNPNYAPALLNLGVLYELYRGELDKALTQYALYQSVLLEPDEKVSRWIVDLNRRISTRDAAQIAEAHPR